VRLEVFNCFKVVGIFIDKAHF